MLCAHNTQWKPVQTRNSTQSEAHEQETYLDLHRKTVALGAFNSVLTLQTRTCVVGVHAQTLQGAQTLAQRRNVVLQCVDRLVLGNACKPQRLQLRRRTVHLRGQHVSLRSDPQSADQCAVPVVQRVAQRLTGLLELLKLACALLADRVDQVAWK